MFIFKKVKVKIVMFLKKSKDVKKVKDGIFVEDDDEYVWWNDFMGGDDFIKWRIFEYNGVLFFFEYEFWFKYVKFIYDGIFVILGYEVEEVVGFWVVMGDFEMF